MGPLAPAPGGLTLRLRVQPRARRTELVGLHGDAVRVRLAAAPEDGAANDALVRFLAERLGVPRSSVRITAGAASRSKSVAVSGISVAAAARRLGLPDSCPGRRRG